MRSPDDPHPGVAGLLAVILCCLVTSELLHDGLSPLELAATGAAFIALAGVEIVVRCRERSDPHRWVGSRLGSSSRRRRP
ncbi:MAG: hypothetical protein M3011_04150 [Actinomycetota bacterium]|nr:hypothetical protein [Actinomycetota bacterium]